MIPEPPPYQTFHKKSVISYWTLLVSTGSSGSVRFYHQYSKVIAFQGPSDIITPNSVKEVIPGASVCAPRATQILKPRPEESLGKALHTRWAPRGVADGLGSAAHPLTAGNFLPSPSPSQEFPTSFLSAVHTRVAFWSGFQDASAVSEQTDQARSGPAPGTRTLSSKHGVCVELVVTTEYF